MPRFFSLFLITFISFPAFSQYQAYHFRVKDGLPSDIVKDANQDSLGFMWFATDNGLSKYDGIRFENFDSSLPTVYIKQLIKTKSGGLYAISDLSFTKIINGIDTVIFETVLEGARNPVEGKLWYPKSVYEQNDGTLWFGEPQAIVKYTKNSFKRYLLDEVENSPNFVRSLEFTEDDKGTLWISGYVGMLHYYNPDTETIEDIKLPPELSEINSIHYWNNKLWLGASSGLYQLTIENYQIQNIERISDKVNISHIYPNTSKSLIIGSFTGENFEVKLNVFKYEFQEYEGTYPVTNRVFKDNENNIWFNHEKGVSMLYPTAFRSLSSGYENSFIEATALDLDQSTIYYCNKNNLEKIVGDRRISIDQDLTGYFLGMVINKRGLWVSNQNRIYHYQNDKKVKSYDFADEGQYIFSLASDDEDNIWFSQERFKGLKMIDNQGEVNYYGPESGINHEVNTVYACASGIWISTDVYDSYLLFKPKGSTSFINMSVPPDFEFQSEFRLTNMVESGDTLIIGSTVGLLYYDIINKKLTRADFGDLFTDSPVRALYKVDNDNIWFSNSLGLNCFKISEDDMVPYDETNGLPSNTVNMRSLVVDKEGSIWAGTASGLAVKRSYNSNEILTQPPRILNLFYNDINRLYAYKEDKVLFPASSVVEIEFASPSYPSNLVEYSYRLNGPDQKNEWSVPEYGYQVNFSDLSFGEYEFQVRGRKVGNQQWSLPSTFSFEMERTLFETWWVRLIFAMAIGVSVWLIIHLTQRYYARRQKELESQVNLKTHELSRAIKELEYHNLELKKADSRLTQQYLELESTNKELDQFVYSVSHDLSAPLKSLLGLINISDLETTDPSIKSNLRMMKLSVNKLEKFIKDVINFSRNSRQNIQYSEINLREFIVEILDDLRYSEYFDQIEFKLHIPKKAVINTDETRLKIILNNLLSNALKFQRHNESKKRVEVSLKEIGNEYQIVVWDNGIGIPDEHLQNIFDMFYRASYDSKGSGLGLYILKETVNKINGHVRVKSTVNKETEFTVIIPKRNPDSIPIEEMDIEDTRS